MDDQNQYLQLMVSLALDNKYTRWYVRLCNHALERTSPQEYTENHHIVPRSFKLGGLKERTNQVVLTAREHYIAHLLLTRMFTGQRRYKMLAAAFMMANRTWIRSRTYAFLRESYAKELSFRRKGQKVAPDVLAARRGRKHKHEIPIARNIHASILVEQTIAELGYDPRVLKPQSNRKVFVQFPCCGVIKEKPFYAANKGIPSCRPCFLQANLTYMNRAEGKAAAAERMRQKWTDPHFRNKTTKAVAKANSQRIIQKTQ